MSPARRMFIRWGLALGAVLSLNAVSAPPLSAQTPAGGTAATASVVTLSAQVYPSTDGHVVVQVRLASRQAVDGLTVQLATPAGIHVMQGSASTSVTLAAGESRRFYYVLDAAPNTDAQATASLTSANTALTMPPPQRVALFADASAQHAAKLPAVRLTVRTPPATASRARAPGGRTSQWTVTGDDAP